MMAAENSRINDDSPRRQKLEQIRQLGHDPFGQRFDNRTWIADIRALQSEIKFKPEQGNLIDLPSEDLVPPAEFRQWLKDQGPGQLLGPAVRAAGRIMLHRDKGKLLFIDIQDWTGTIQLFVGRNQVGDENWELIQCLDLGDLIGVDGQLRKTQTGEMSIFADRIHILGKTLDPPPAKHKGMTDPELRQRMRYVDLAYNDGVRDRFLDRFRIVQSIRETLASEGFVETEGPTLHSIAGGAAAKPFTTHHNALGLDLFMRIALELHLKRLMVGGMERVFEMGRVYRNEGISPRHNPEFTMLEVYQAYGNYETMMDLTESLIAGALDAVETGPQVQYGETSIDFSTPFERASYNELFQKHTGVSPRDTGAVKELARSIGFKTEGKHEDVIKNEIFEDKVEDQLTGPIFVLDYPAEHLPTDKTQARSSGNCRTIRVICERDGNRECLHGIERSGLAGGAVSNAITGHGGRGFDGQNGPRFRAGAAQRHAAGRRIGRGHRPAGDVADEFLDDSRRNPVSAVASRRTLMLIKSTDPCFASRIWAWAK